jgi:hypothetical protein
MPSILWRSESDFSAESGDKTDALCLLVCT